MKDFINEYKNAYLAEFESDFWGRLDRLCVTLCDPKFHPSIHLSSKLNSLRSHRHKPINIAVVGQFSSGKSTFLNTLLGEEILPTGIIPVTAKVTKIEWAPLLLLKIVLNDGSEILQEISALQNYTDQRTKIKSVRNLTIFNSAEILKKVSFSDTPGLNSRSKSDTAETIRELKNADGLFWISLIDNAARASEKDEILALPKELKQNSLFLLSQKDRLSDDEISRVLKHSFDTLKESFYDIVAISSRLQKDGKHDSGFDKVYNFIDNLSKNKEKIIEQKTLNLIEILVDERKFYIQFYDKLCEIIDSWDKSCLERIEFYAEEYAKFYAKIKEISTDISETFMKSIYEKNSEYFRQNNGFFSKNYKKNEYKKPYFNKDEALMRLIYNDDSLSSIFRRLKSSFKNLNEQIKSEILSDYARLKDEILFFKSEFETINRQNELHSIVEISHIAKIASEVYELFLKDFEKIYHEFTQNLALFMEKINIKIINNYQNAVKLSADFIGDKVLKSVDDYESDPLTFSLFYPKFDDFSKAILENLQYFEFENDFIGTSNFISREISHLKRKKSEILDKNYSYINAQKFRQETIISQITKAKKEFLDENQKSAKNLESL